MDDLATVQDVSEKSDHFGTQYPNEEEVIESEDEDPWSFDIIEVGPADAELELSKGNWIELGHFELPSKQLSSELGDNPQESDGNLETAPDKKESFLVKEQREQMTPFEFQSLQAMTASSIDTVGSTVEEVFTHIEGSS